MTGKKGAEEQTLRPRVTQLGAIAPRFDRSVQPIKDFAPKQALGSFSLEGESSFEWLTALYRSIVETSPDAITVTSADGKVVFCNQQAAVLHGFTCSEEMLGRHAWDFVALEDRERASADFKRMLSAETIQGVEYTLLRADGDRVPVQLSASAIKDNAGTSRAFIGIVRDVTQHQRTEEALRRSEEHFRTLIENAPDLITLMDPTGVIKYQSPSVERVLGYEPEELVGTNIWRLVNPDDQKAVGDAFAKGVFTPGSFTPLVFRVRHKDGPWRYLEGTGKLLTDESGRPFAIINSRDVTDRVLAEQALEENERRKAAILDTALDAIITIDHESRVLEFNPAAEEMFGYQAAEIVGKKIDELIVPPSLRKRHRRGMKRYLAGGEGPILGQRVELTAMRADGSEFPAELAIVRIKSEGPPLFTGHVRDLSERRRWEEELERAKEEMDDKSEQVRGGGNVYTLTLRELTVLHLVARGKADKEIAVTLGISSQTVNKHVARILHKMGASSRTEAGVRAIKDQIVE